MPCLKYILLAILGATLLMGFMVTVDLKITRLRMVLLYMVLVLSAVNSYLLPLTKAAFTNLKYSSLRGLSWGLTLATCMTLISNNPFRITKAVSDYTTALIFGLMFGVGIYDYNKKK